MKPVVYVAGPYSYPDPVDNMRRALVVATELWEVMVPVVPHLTGFWHFLHPRPWEEWLAYDEAILGRCDALLRLEGDSEGADREVDFAVLIGLPVFAEKDRAALLRWALERTVPQ